MLFVKHLVQIVSKCPLSATVLLTMVLNTCMGSRRFCVTLELSAVPCFDLSCVSNRVFISLSPILECLCYSRDLHDSTRIAYGLSMIAGLLLSSFAIRAVSV